MDHERFNGSIRTLTDKNFTNIIKSLLTRLKRSEGAALQPVARRYCDQTNVLTSSSVKGNS